MRWGRTGCGDAEGTQETLTGPPRSWWLRMLPAPQGCPFGRPAAAFPVGRAVEAGGSNSRQEVADVLDGL